jgi:acyl-CoA thioester hydrolase
VSHETTVRVRYGEVDRMGVVYHANYLAYVEQGRTEMLRSLGRAYRDVEEAGVLLVVVDVGLQFRRPAGYDDLLRVRTRLVDASGVRIRFEYEIERVENGALVATAHTTLATTDKRGRPIRPPEELARLFAGVVEGAADGKRGSGVGVGEGSVPSDEALA